MKHLKTFKQLNEENNLITNTDNLLAGDIVYIDYMNSGVYTPVKIVKKVGDYYTISHQVSGSQCMNKPDESIHKNTIKTMGKSIAEPVEGPDVATSLLQKPSNDMAINGYPKTI